MQIGFAQHDGAGIKQALHLGGIGTGRKTGQRPRGASGRQVGGGVIVLQKYGNAMQRAARAGAAALGIQRGGLLPGSRVQRQQGIERRPLIVVRGDACEIRLHQAHRRCAPGRERHLQLAQRGVGHLKRPLRHARARQPQTGQCHAQGQRAQNAAQRAGGLG